MQIIELDARLSLSWIVCPFKTRVQASESEVYLWDFYYKHTWRAITVSFMCFSPLFPSFWFFFSLLYFSLPRQDRKNIMKNTTMMMMMSSSFFVIFGNYYYCWISIIMRCVYLYDVCMHGELLNKIWNKFFAFFCLARLASGKRKERKNERCIFTIFHLLFNYENQFFSCSISIKVYSIKRFFRVRIAWFW